jgi:predicted SprT family Zn-dependent metalloprotease
MIITKIPIKIQALINKAYLAIKEKRPEWLPIVDSITWEMNTRTFRVLGRAFLIFNKIQLSYDYAMNGNEESVYDTITHELAHLIAFKVYKDRGHGYMWKMVHRELGGSAERTANREETGMPVKRNKVKRVILERNGKEYHTTINRYTGREHMFVGFTYLRTVIIHPDDSEEVIHRSKEVPISGFLATCAAQTVA